MSQPLFAALFDETDRGPLTVSELTTAVRNTLEARFAAVWVEGEISNFRPHSSGHWYFTIKDEGAQIRAKCFRSSNTRIRFRPQDGSRVRARGRLTVYPPRGEYEVVVESLEPVGAGALRVAFEQLRDRLKAEGLFAPELKRTLPMFPRRVGVITSASGAALRDILNVISRRTRTVHVLFSPARVQGEGAGRDIARAIRFVNQHHRQALAAGRLEDAVDVLIVGRGGGSTEDLWAFNEEEVARAIRASNIPVISAVGHETDFTIADFAADLRAPTPSAAAELVAAHEDEICKKLDRLSTNLHRLTRFKIIDARTLVQEYALSRVFDDVRAKLRDAAMRTDRSSHELRDVMNLALQLAQRRANALQTRLSPVSLRARVVQAHTSLGAASNACNEAMTARLEVARRRLSVAAASLDALSPLAVLQRGYAIAQAQDGRLLHDSNAVAVGDAVRLRLARGRLDCRVEARRDDEGL